MAASMLGKRSRLPEAGDDSTPLKRTRRSTRAFVVNDENQDPEAVSFEDAIAADLSASKAAGAATRKASICSPVASPSPKASRSSPVKAAVPITPSTPRFRDGPVGPTSAVSANRRTVSTPATPVTPTTPRFRVMSVGRLSRRTTPHRPHGPHGTVTRGDATPMTPRTPSAVSTVYHVARQLFSRSTGAAAAAAGGSAALIGRDDERARLGSFLDDNCGPAATKTGCGCLYVSGPPGTGKSAMVSEMTEAVCAARSGTVRRAYINCMSVRSSDDLYRTLLRALVCDNSSGDDNNDTEASTAAMDIDMANSTDAIGALQALLVPKSSGKKGNTTGAQQAASRTYLVVLDEIDHILTIDLDSLYRVIEWAMLKTSRLVLVGIANALDLTDRFLPRLKSRNLQPELLPFLPYTAPQVKHIITTRLRSVLPAAGVEAVPTNFVPFFHPAAIELCARKVASQTGDLRKAFEILRRALDLVEAEARHKYLNEARDADEPLTATPSKKQPLGENTNLASSPPSPPSPKRISWAAWAAQNLTVESAPRVSIGHLNKVTSAAFGHGAQQRLRGLNLQQKAALCALVAYEKWNREAHAAAAAATSLSAMASPNGVRKLVKAPRTPSSAAAADGTAAPTIKKLFATYNQMCKRDAVLHPLSSSEFREVVGSLETLSLVTAVDGRTGSFVALQSAPGSGGGRRGRRASGAVSGLLGGSMGGGGAGVTGVAGDEKRVASCVGEKELQQALEGAGADILQSILSGEGLD